MTKYFIKGVGEVNLTQQDFIAEGGEGKVFGKGGTAYKICLDPSKMIPIGKIQELGVLQHPCIINPQNLILDKSNQSIGYTMQLVNGSALCQLFTKSFCNRNNIDTHKKLSLVKKFHGIVDYVHKTSSGKILLVDLNEYNFLASADFNDIYAIDVNSYQTPSYPATVIMPSIRDRHCHNHFTQDTDWFSWGIVTFQMMIGIHPYKGEHPDFDGIPRDERMHARMMKNISLFHSGVTYPAVCMPFDIIPQGLRNWYKAIFEDGKRCPPPADFEGGVIVLAPVFKQLTGSNLLNITEMQQFQQDIVQFYSHEGNRFVLTNQLHLGQKTYAIPKTNANFIFTPKLNRLVCAYIENGMAKVFDVENQTFYPISLAAKEMIESNGRIYIQNNTNVMELNCMEIGKTVQFSFKVTGNILDIPGATKAFDGGFIQNLLGRYYVSIFPTSGKCHQIGIAELDKYLIVQAKYDKNILVVIGADRKTGKYDRFVFRFDDTYSAYDVRKVENISLADINFTVNDKGICVLMTEDEKLEVFSNKKDSGHGKTITDPVINSDMQLCSDGAKIQFFHRKKLYSLSMK